MANQEHLDILKQGVEAWNQWIREHSDIRPDFVKANLAGANLQGIYLRGANLSRANLSRANLVEANLDRAYLQGVNFREANLSRANLSWTDFSRADLRETNLDQSIIMFTVFGDVDLSAVKGLETVRHRGPSTVGIDTIYRSQGQIPENFLQKAGVPETFLTNMRALVRSMSPIEFYSCFISYSSQDQGFAERLYADLQSKGVRCWFAPEDLRWGDEIRLSIDESIRLYDKLLLVLSEHSVASQWVQQEVETALAKERKEQRTVLFPIRLDKAAMEIEGGWPAFIHNTRNIGDFTRWKDPNSYQKALDRLLRNLKAEASMPKE